MYMLHLKLLQPQAVGAGPEKWFLFANLKDAAICAHQESRYIPPGCDQLNSCYEFDLDKKTIVQVELPTVTFVTKPKEERNEDSKPGIGPAQGPETC